MSFSLPRFLRRTQSSDLQKYFTARDIPFSEQVDWTAEPASLLSSVKAVIEALPERERERVFEDFERIDQLSDDIGQAHCSPSSIKMRRSFVSFIPATAVRHVVFSYSVTDEEAFDNALATAYAERMRHGRSWSGYCLPAPLAPSKNPSDIAPLEGDLGALFHRFDGTGRKLKIETFERRTADFPGGPCRQIVHYSVYVEGLPECSIEFERNEPKRRTRRPVIEAAICCDPVTGILDVVSKGGRPLREEIAKSFADRLLDSETALTPVSRRDFDLDRLKRLAAFSTDPVDRVKSVTVTLLRLRTSADHFGRVTIDIDGVEHGDIQSRSACWFGDSDLLRRPDWQVTQANLKIAFYPEAKGKRAKTINVELRAPNGSNLGDQTRRHQIVSEKYLARWGLIKNAMAAVA
jgi:hypothetical protein